MLFSAVKGGKEDCVAILLENHADINAIGAVSIVKLCCSSSNHCLFISISILKKTGK